MICKDCLHYYVCGYRIDEETDMSVAECSHFKDKNDFVDRGGDIKESTVTIALCEYRNLITEQTRNEAEIDRLQDRLKQAEEWAKLMTEVVVFEHPEFFRNAIDAVIKFLKKTREPVSSEEVDCDERTETM